MNVSAFEASDMAPYFFWNFLVKPTSYTFDKYSTSFNFIYFYQYEDASRLSELVQGVSVPKNTEAQNLKVRKSRQTSSLVIKHVNKVISEQALKD